MRDHHIDFDMMTIPNRIATIRTLFLDYVLNQNLDLNEVQEDGALEELEWFINNIRDCIDEIKTKT